MTPATPMTVTAVWQLISQSNVTTLSKALVVLLVMVHEGLKCLPRGGNEVLGCTTGEGQSEICSHNRIG